MLTDTRLLHAKRSNVSSLFIWVTGSVFTGIGLFALLGIILTIDGSISTTMNAVEEGIVVVVALFMALFGLVILLQSRTRTLTLTDGSLTLSGPLKFITHPISMRTDNIERIAVYQTIGKGRGVRFLVLFDKTGKPFPLNLYPFSRDERLKLVPFLQQLMQDSSIKKPELDATVKINKTLTTWYGKQHGIDMSEVKSQDHPLEMPSTPEVIRNWLIILLIIAVLVIAGVLLNNVVHLTYIGFKEIIAVVFAIPTLLAFIILCLLRFRIYYSMFF